jgi:hypothetical protein
MFYPKGSANQIVASEANWATAQLDTGTSELLLMPVIAWFLVTRVGDYSPGVKPDHSVEKLVSVEVYPITVDGIEDNPVALKSPSGLFTIPNNRCNMTAQECLAELKSNTGGGS